MSKIGISLSKSKKKVSSPAGAIQQIQSYVQDGLIQSIELWMANFLSEANGPIKWPWEYSEEIIKSTYKALKTIPHKGAHIPFAFINAASLNPGIRKESIRQLELSLEVAAKIGLNYVVTHPRFGCLDIIPMDEEFRIWQDTFEQLEKKARQHGLIFTIENGDRLNFEQCADMVRQINSPHFAMTFDTGHAHLEGNKDRKYEKYTSLAEFVLSEKSCIYNIHLHDNDCNKDQHLVPGEGTLDFPAMFDALYVAPAYDSYVTLECNWGNLEDIVAQVSKWRQSSKKKVD